MRISPPPNPATEQSGGFGPRLPYARDDRMTQHTPGPWRVSPTLFNDSLFIEAGLKGFNERTVVIVSRHKDEIKRNGDTTTFRKVSIPTAEADANLIAAAPDLLAACEEFVRKVEAGKARSTKSYEKMRAAVRKARGEAS